MTAARPSAEPDPVHAASAAPRPAAQKPRLWLLALTATLFVAWTAWLIWQVVTGSDAVVVSRSQALMAPLIAITHINQPPTALVRVIYRGGQLIGLPAGAAEANDLAITVFDLDAAEGYRGPGSYLLLLTPEEPQAAAAAGRSFRVVPIPVALGLTNDLGTRVYPDSPSIRLQAANVTAKP